jgi:hypothetical protein
LPTGSAIYDLVASGEQLHQAEIITGIIQYLYDSRDNSVRAISHDYCVVGSQECDLARDFEARESKRPSPLDGILLYVATSAVDARATIGGRDIWKPLIQNKNERYHALEEVPGPADFAKAGVPPLIVDFRRFYTITSDELHWQIDGMKTALRRTRLAVPYREHLQGRAAAYLARVALDRDHDVPMTPTALPPPG